MQNSTSQVTLPATSTPKGAWFTTRRLLCGCLGGAGSAALIYFGGGDAVIHMANKLGEGVTAEGVMTGLFYFSVAMAAVCATELSHRAVEHVKRSVAEVNGVFEAIAP